MKNRIIAATLFASAVAVAGFATPSAALSLAPSALSHAADATDLSIHVATARKVTRTRSVTNKRSVTNHRTVNRSHNVNVNVRKRVVVRPVRPWVARPWFGTVVAGVTIGTVIAATSVPPAPGPNLCWFWSDSSNTRGYWDYCSPPR